MTSSESREDLLYLLERALQGGLLGAPEDDEPDEDELEEYEYGLEDDEDELDEDDEGGVATLDSGHIIGPHTLMRATSKGELFLSVGLVLERWLGKCPKGPLQIGPEGGDPVAALVCCWSATVTHALAREPLTLAELARAVDLLDYETAEEHLTAMLRTGLVEAQPGPGEARYAPTEWLREGVAPLAAAARAEVLCPEEDVAPPDILDVEAAFQLALPLLRLPPDLLGSCRLGVQIPGGPPLMAGATVQVDRGCVVTSSPLLEQEPETWATGSPRDWLDTLVDPSAERIKVGGDTRITEALLMGLHERLFAQPEP
jgi:hypothetical protein